MQARRQSRCIQTLSTLALLTLPLSSALGQSITYTVALPLQQSDWDKTASLPRFDTALGTLQSLDVLLDGGIEAQYIFDNHRGNALDITLYSQGQVILDDPTGSPFLHVEPQEVDTAHLEAEGVLVDYFDVSASMATHLTDPSALAPFLGAGNILLDVQAKGTSYASASTYFTSIVTSEQVSVSVTYNYTASSVPEPGALALFLVSSFSGAYWAVRRRKQPNG